MFRGMAGQMGGKPRGKGGGAARTEKENLCQLLVRSS